jgi:hypothetical protein
MDAEKKLYASGRNPLFIQPSRPLPKEVAIIGAGTIGPDIGYYIKSALPRIKLYLVDVVEAALKNAEKRYEDYAKKAVEKRKMKEDKAKEILQNIVYTMDYSQIKNCDLVIEAATENIPLKQKIFESVESIVREDAVITSNTSSIPADRIFNKMKRPQRATITHFFAPAWRSLPVDLISFGFLRRQARFPSSRTMSSALCSIGFSTTGAMTRPTCSPMAPPARSTRWLRSL